MKNTIKDKSQNLAVENNFPKKLPSSDLQLGSFSERLQLIAGGRKPRPFALELGIPPSTFHQYFNGQSEPTRPVLSVIADKTGVNMQWLVDGNGPMMKDDVASSQRLAASHTPQFTVTDFQGRQLDFKPDPNLIHIPVLSLEAACGMGTFADESYITAMFSATREWLALTLRRNPDNLYLIHARGDSMADTIKPDDMVFVDPSEAKQPSDGIWVFALEESLFIKRLQFLPGRKIKVTSDNPRYEPYLLSPDHSFRLLARYIATLNIKT